MWDRALDIGFYVLATIGCGTFFTWVAISIAKLRRHEHRQNNALAQVVLLQHQQAEDLAAIRDHLGVPR